jgi:hypothetical protein
VRVTWLHAVAIVLAAACLPGSTRAATLVVDRDGKLSTFAEAVRLARDGDTIEVLPGAYRGDTAVITQKRLTIRGIGARPVFVADGSIAEGKAIWVVRDGEVTVDNIEFRDARAADLNGAGIRFEKGRLAVRRCAFVNNENGILTANFSDAELSIEDSEFTDVPPIEGKNHLLYVGRIAKLTVRGSRFHRGALGHLIKSRARESTIAYNLIVDGPSGNASYEVDLPDGGVATLIGNIIAKGRSRDNPVVVAYGAEGSTWERNVLVLSHNTLINDGWKPAWFLRVWSGRLPVDAEVRAINNLSLGLGVFALAAPGRFDGNWHGVRAMLVAPDRYDFALHADAMLRGRAVDPAVAGVAFVPQFEFRMPIGTVPLAPPAQWTPGALQR